jgi:signal transduction histidine kinase
LFFVRPPIHRLVKLRGRLFAFSSAQLLVFGALFAVMYVELQKTAMPMLAQHLREKSETSVRALASQLDVPLGAGDPAEVARVIEPVAGDEDFDAIEVVDVKGDVVFRRGPASDVVRSGAAATAREGGGLVRAWSPISFEGVQLGSVSVAFTTSRVDALRTWIAAIALASTLAWLGALVYSFVFARAFVAPIHAMKEFSRSVAAGDFRGQLVASAAGELDELREHLNTMTRDLQQRELELVAMSRTAGMAEVATGVLHNVGNVLNSLNVSVSLIGDQARSSKVAALTRAVALYAAHPGGLPALLATDKGKLLPQYLTTVSETLVRENEELCRELSSVTGNVDHIKSIVAMQQKYARVSGARESVDVAGMLDDAIGLAADSLARHRIELVREYADAPAIVSDRHKLLQIVVNLLSNARQALAESGRQDGLRLTIRIVRRDAWLAVTVEDNGVGIPAENLERIFRHGFTTKAGGHGFGLHSSANSARELGGSLEARSDGVGHGSVFTLMLPLDAA